MSPCCSSGGDGSISSRHSHQHSTVVALGTAGLHWMQHWPKLHTKAYLKQQQQQQLRVVALDDVLPSLDAAPAAAAH
jgi:hypothetical protein